MTLLARIWIPRGFGIPPFPLYAVASRMNDDVEFLEPNPRTRTVSADLAPPRGPAPADLDPDSQRIVEDLFRQVSMSWLTVTDRLLLAKKLLVVC